MGGGTGHGRKRSGRVRIALAAAVVVLIAGGAAWVLSREPTGLACTLGLSEGPVGATPEEAAALYLDELSSDPDDPGVPGVPVDPAMPAPVTDGRADDLAAYERRSDTEWRLPTGPDSYRKLAVERTADDKGWQVTDNNECTEVDV